MKAYVKSYRRGKNTSKNNQVILEIEDVNSPKEAKEYVGKKVVYHIKGDKKMKGKIRAPHGNSGALRARFKKGVPGQIIGSKLEVEG